MDTITCPIEAESEDKITLRHGAGGRQMHQLLASEILSVFNDTLSPQTLSGHDAAVLNLGTQKLSFTTDSYVVNPLFFPGGDIGKLAVCGTLNDLAMSGAKPRYISASFILEDGFPIKKLKAIIQSMRDSAKSAGVEIVTGDTKVVEHHKGDGIYINTAGIGEITHQQTIHPSSIQAGDAVIVSGDIGRHGMAVIIEREQLKINTTLESDCANLAPVVQALLDEKLAIHCLRDITRGGLGTTLCELAEDSGLSIEIKESSIPIHEDVFAVSEILGINPLYTACEGRFVLICPQEQANKAMEILGGFEMGQQAALLGSVLEEPKGQLIQSSDYGVKKIIRMLAFEELPRIC